MWKQKAASPRKSGLFDIWLPGAPMTRTASRERVPKYTFPGLPENDWDFTRERTEGQKDSQVSPCSRREFNASRTERNARISQVEPWVCRKLRRKIVASSACLRYPVNELVGRALRNRKGHVQHGPTRMRGCWVSGWIVLPPESSRFLGSAGAPYALRGGKSPPLRLSLPEEEKERRLAEY